MAAPLQPTPAWCDLRTYENMRLTHTLLLSVNEKTEGDEDVRTFDASGNMRQTHIFIRVPALVCHRRESAICSLSGARRPGPI